VDEIIVVHDGPCTDQTLVIAQRFKAQIFVREFIGEAEPHRVFAYKQASGDWILQLDADEYLSPALSQNLRLLAENEAISAYEFVWPLWDGQKKISSDWPAKSCFWRRDKLAFLGLPHFAAKVSGQIQSSNLVLCHEPEYNNYEWPRFKNKWLPWARIQAEYYRKDFGSIAKFNYTGRDWPWSVKLRRQIPGLIMPFDFILVFFRTWLSGAYRLRLVGFKVALMQGAYRAAIDYYLIKLKFRK
jgi:hypothetical protein